ncbi:MAG TPA: hypothetical protein PLV45_12630, partial [bacterium]|nr:hypothetical protein [bacterium]
PRELRERLDFRAAAHVILDNYREGDCIGTTCVSGAEPAWYYLTYRGGLPSGQLLDLDGRYRRHIEQKYGLLDYVTTNYPFLLPTNLDIMIRDATCRRLWLFESQWESGIRPGDFYYEHRIGCREWLSTRFLLLEEWTFNGVDVRLFDLGAPRQGSHNE